VHVGHGRRALQAGSISKAVTAVATLLLVGDGVLGHLGGAHGFTSALDVSAVDGSGAVVTSDLHNGFDIVLPALAAAVGTTVVTP
jgi:hypothetical protein